MNKSIAGVALIILLVGLVTYYLQKKELNELKAKLENVENDINHRIEVKLEIEKKKNSILDLVLSNNYHEAITLIDSINQNDSSAKLTQTKLNILAFVEEFEEQIGLSQQNRLLYGQIEEFNETLLVKEDSVINLAVNIEMLQDQLKALSDAYNEVENELRAQIREEQEKYEKALSSRSVLRFKTAGGKDILYFGETKDGKANGYGVGLWTDGSTYEGFWEKNMRNGTGTQEWKDGELYEGAYKNDKREGFGIYTWSNGEQYKGDWKNDIRHGKGIIYDQNGEPIQAGEFENDRLKKRMNAEEVFEDN
ncbi:MORN repeat-containing protein [Peijinzhouia sedimentorum]